MMSGGFSSQDNFAPGGVAYGYGTAGPYLRPGNNPGESPNQFER